jgi:hypothetical protein
VLVRHHASQQRFCPRDQLSDSEVALEIERVGAECPLSPAEITEWAKKLKSAGVDRETRLRNLVTYWFHQASSLSRIWRAADEVRVRHYFKFRLENGDAPGTIALPAHFHRIDKWLPDISQRLNAIRIELLGLPVDVDAALRVRFGGYDEALGRLAALPPMLNAVAGVWHRQRPGQPSLELESGAVGLLTCAIEDFTGQQFPSPRSYKRLAEIEFVRLLAARLFPAYTLARINTMLRHYHGKRLAEVMTGRPRQPGRPL